MGSLLQPKPNSRPITVTPENLQHLRAEFTRLSARYAQLAWSTSANDQRERADLQDPLMELYLALHPDSKYSRLDDFDMVIRVSRRS